MTCHINCDSCDLDRAFDDCTEAHVVARDHEATHEEHFVSLRNTGRV